jgi:hypothetical protein
MPEKTFAEKMREGYTNVRNAAYEALLQPGGKGSHQTHKDYFHTQGNYLNTKRLGRVLPPHLAAGLVDTAYQGNEAMTGVLAKLAGKPYFSEYGFNREDLDRNRRGQERAVAELLREQADAAERANTLRGFSMPYGK